MRAWMSYKLSTHGVGWMATSVQKMTQEISAIMPIMLPICSSSFLHTYPPQPWAMVLRLRHAKHECAPPPVACNITE